MQDLKNDLTEVTRSHENKWVALSKETDRVILSENTLAALLKKLDRKDYDKVILFKVPDFEYCYAPPINQV